MSAITIFRDSGEGFLKYLYNGQIFPLEIIQGNLFKIHEDYSELINHTEYKILEIKTEDGIPTFVINTSKGTQGAQGTIGTQGATGTGNPGSPGGKGAQGFQGFQGAAGGGSGSQGAQGFQGLTGATGSQGAAGAQGSQGSQGAQGAGIGSIVDDNTTNAVMYPTWVSANAGVVPLEVSSLLTTFNPSTSQYTFGTNATTQQYCDVFGSGCSTVDVTWNFVRNQNAVSRFRIGNNNTGTAAATALIMDTDPLHGVYGAFEVVSSTNSTSGGPPSTFFIFSGSGCVNGIEITTDNASGFIAQGTIPRGVSGAKGLVLDGTEKVGIGTRSPSAWLTIGALGTTSIAPFKLTSSGTTFLATPQAGAIEFGTPGFVIQNDALVMGATALLGAEKLSLQSSANSTLSEVIKNSSSGNGAGALLELKNNLNHIADHFITSSGYTPVSDFIADQYSVYTNCGGGMAYFNDNASTIKYYSGGFASANKILTLSHTTSFIQPAAGTATVSPIKLTAGTALTTPVAGSIEYITGAFVYQNDAIIVGAKALIGTEQISVQSAGNISSGIYIKNTSSGGSAFPALTLSNNAGKYAQFSISGGSYTPVGGFLADQASLDCSTTNGLAFFCEAVAPIKFYTGGFTSTELRMTITGAGLVGVGVSSPTSYITIKAGTTTVAPLQLTSGTNLTTASAGAFEYNGTNLFFTRTGTTRENILVAVDNATAPSTSIGAGIVNFYGGSATNFLGDPNRWMSINILGTIYKVPLYT